MLAWIKALKKEVLDQTLELCDRLVDVTVPAAAVRFGDDDDHHAQHSSGWVRARAARTLRETYLWTYSNNSPRGRLLRHADRLAPITMHHWTDLIEPDLMEPQTLAIGDHGPA